MIINTNIIKKKMIALSLCLCMVIPVIQAFNACYQVPVAYAATYSQEVKFSYKMGYGVDGRSNARFHYLKAGKPTLKLTSLQGASSSSPVKVSIYSGDTYYATISAPKKGTYQFSKSLSKGKYWLKIKGGSGYNGWIHGTGTITPVYK